MNIKSPIMQDAQIYNETSLYNQLEDQTMRGNTKIRQSPQINYEPLTTIQTNRYDQHAVHQRSPLTVARNIPYIEGNGEQLYGEQVNPYEFIQEGSNLTVHPNMFSRDSVKMNGRTPYIENKVPKTHPLYEETLYNNQYAMNQSTMKNIRRSVPIMGNKAYLKNNDLPLYPEEDTQLRERDNEARRSVMPSLPYPLMRPPVYIGQADRSPHQQYRNVEDTMMDRSPHQFYRNIDDNHSDRSPHPYYDRSPSQYYRSMDTGYSPRLLGRGIDEDILVYQVEFKLAARHFVTSSTNVVQSKFNVGDFVKVEADRGEDLGK